MNNTMGGFGKASNMDSKIGKGNEGHQFNQSSGAGGGGGATTNLSSSGAGGTTPGGQGESGTGATNQDLNKRLAEMKAKLQALKKK